MKLILGISFFRQYNSTGGGFLILKQIIPCEQQLLIELAINSGDFW
jgi:hypothetical protein